MKISIIIPVLNESNRILTLIEMLAEIEGDKEIIFADGGSEDDTLELIPSNCITVNSSRGRGQQMNKGAEHAAGDVLLFLHCDSILGKDAVRSIQTAIESGFSGGCFTMKFDKRQWLLSIIAYLSNLRVNLLGIIFGDQGMFIRKEIFQSLGGFPDIPIMEDIEFSNKLRKSGRIKQLKNIIVTAARRFEKKGTLRTILFMHKMKILYWMGRSPEELYLRYKSVR